MLVELAGETAGGSQRVVVRPGETLLRRITAAYEGSPLAGRATASSSVSFQAAYSRAACSRHSAGARQSARAPSSSWRPRRASATSGTARCFATSWRAAFSAISRSRSSPKTLQEPVVKSCNRVPTAQTTSASAARAFAEELPVTPIGPANSG